MKSHRISYPGPETVMAEIGEKAVGVFALSIQRARQDLATYRNTFPHWAGAHSERGLANWISDRTWSHLVELAEGIPNIDPYEKGSVREVTVGLNYRFRVKRHDANGGVSSYPTPTFLDFVQQESFQLPGMEETRLLAGYVWDKDLRDVGAAIISLRDGQDNIVWAEVLAEVTDNLDAGDGATIVTPQQARPTPPTIEVAKGVGQTAKELAEEA